MEPSDFKTIRPHLERAIDDIDYFLGADNKRENAREEAGKRYDLMDELLDEGWTPPKGKARGKHRLTKTQYNALVHRTTVYGNPLTDEKREAILADLGPGERMSEAELEALAFWWRGGWRESSRQAAVWLRKAEKTVKADGIDVALSGLPREPRDAAEESDYREDIRAASERVKTILKSCLGPQESEANRESNEAKAAVKNQFVKLLGVFTNNLASDRFDKVTDVLSNENLNANDKLEAIDKLMKIPATASASELGKLIGVSKQAIAKQDWWLQNRKGKQAEAIGKRELKFKQQAELQDFNEVDDFD